MSKTPATLVIDCSLYYRMARDTGVPSLDKKAFQQFLPQSHKTTEQVIKWLPRLFALSAPPKPLFMLLLLSVYLICIATLTIHSCTYSTTSIGPTNQCTPTLANRAICIVSRHPPKTYNIIKSMYSVHHICTVTLTISTCTYYLNQPD